VIVLCAASAELETTFTLLNPANTAGNWNFKVFPAATGYESAVPSLVTTVNPAPPICSARKLTAVPVKDEGITNPVRTLPLSPIAVLVVPEAAITKAIIVPLNLRTHKLALLLMA